MLNPIVLSYSTDQRPHNATPSNDGCGIIKDKARKRPCDFGKWCSWSVQFNEVRLLKHKSRITTQILQIYICAARSRVRVSVSQQKCGYTFSLPLIYCKNNMQRVSLLSGKLVNYVTMVTMATSIMTLTAMSIDRYYAVLKPVDSKRYRYNGRFSAYDA